MHLRLRFVAGAADPESLVSVEGCRPQQKYRVPITISMVAGRLDLL